MVQYNAQHPEFNPCSAPCCGVSFLALSRAIMVQRQVTLEITTERTTPFPQQIWHWLCHSMTLTWNIFWTSNTKSCRKKHCILVLFWGVGRNVCAEFVDGRCREVNRHVYRWPRWQDKRPGWTGRRQSGGHKAGARPRSSLSAFFTRHMGYWEAPMVHCAWYRWASLEEVPFWSWVGLS